MGGFVIECLLKALLLERHPNLLPNIDRAKLSESEAEVRDLIYRRHDLDGMLGFLPELERKLSGIKTGSGHDLWRQFRTVCEEWTVYARYSPQLARLDQAKTFLETVEEVKKWLREV